VSKSFVIKLAVRKLLTADKFCGRETPLEAPNSVLKVCNYLDVQRSAEIWDQTE